MVITGLLVLLWFLKRENPDLLHAPEEVNTSNAPYPPRNCNDVIVLLVVERLVTLGYSENINDWIKSS